MYLNRGQIEVKGEHDLDDKQPKRQNNKQNNKQANKWIGLQANKYEKYLYLL